MRTWQALAPGTWPLGLGLAALVVTAACLVRGREHRSSIPWRGAAALVVTAFVVALFMGTRAWLKSNQYVPRYLLPSVILVQAALAMLIVVPLSRACDAGTRRLLPASVALALLLGAAAAYGLPSPGRVRADLERLGDLTPDVLAARCTHLAGDYWTVWPTIFHAHLVLNERGEQRPLWGVTFRAQPTSQLWWNTPLEGRIVGIPLHDPYGEKGRVVGIPLHDTFGDNWLLAFGMPGFRDVERRDTLRVLRRQRDTDEVDRRR
jgi:hypothetical protein